MTEFDHSLNDIEVSFMDLSVIASPGDESLIDDDSFIGKSKSGNVTSSCSKDDSLMVVYVSIKKLSFCHLCMI